MRSLDPMTKTKYFAFVFNHPLKYIYINKSEKKINTENVQNKKVQRREEFLFIAYLVFFCLKTGKKPTEHALFNRSSAKNSYKRSSRIMESAHCAHRANAKKNDKFNIANVSVKRE